MEKAKPGITKANLEAIHEVAPGLLKQLEKVDEVQVPIEKDVKITGLKNPTTVVLLGFSSDHVLRQLLNEKKKVIKYIVVIEPNLGVFKSAIQRHYIGDVINNPNIDWFIGTHLGDLGTLLYKAFSDASPETGARASITQNPEVVPDPFVFAPTGPGTQELKDQLTQIVLGASSQTFLSMGCAPDSFARWDQTAKNFENLKTKYNISDLQGKVWGPIVVVGGGPSVEDFIANCKKFNMEKNSLIIAVDAVLIRLLKEGIKPHIVVRCERKLTGIFDGVTKEATKGILYAGYNWTSPEFFDLFDEGAMLYRGNGVCLWTGYPHLQVNGGVSSGNAALELAWLLSHKGNNIYLTGIDLCMIDDKTHVGGTKVEFDIEKSKKLWTQYPCNDGEDRTTIPVWVRCRQEYETSMIKYSNQKPVKVWNMSPKGSKLHGAEPNTWSKVESVFKTDLFVKEKLKKHLKKISDKEIEQFDKNVDESIKYLKEVQDDLKETFNNLDDCHWNIRSEEQKIVKKVRIAYDPAEVFKLVRNYEDSLVALYNNPCRIIDNFKARYFPSQQFSNLILDTVQLDVFKVENKAHSLRNTVKNEFERKKAYCQIYQDLFHTIDHYLEKMLELLEEYVNRRDVPKS